MELSVHLPASVVVAATTTAARYSVSVDDLAHRAIVEYIADLEVGLLGPPERAVLTVTSASRSANRQREMVERIRQGQVA